MRSLGLVAVIVGAIVAFILLASLQSQKKSKTSPPPHISQAAANLASDPITGLPFYAVGEAVTMRDGSSDVITAVVPVGDGTYNYVLAGGRVVSQSDIASLSTTPIAAGQKIQVQTSSGAVVTAQTASSGGTVANVVLPSGQAVSGVGYVPGQSAPGQLNVQYQVSLDDYRANGGDYWAGPPAPFTRTGSLLLVPGGAPGTPAKYADMAGNGAIVPWNNAAYPIVKIFALGSDAALKFALLSDGTIQVPVFSYV